MTDIDYGLGQTNIDKETGIRYGFINQNKLSPYAWEDVMSNGEDQDYADFKAQLKQDLETAIEGVLSNYNLDRLNHAENMAEEIVDNMEIEYESNGDSPRYHYECDGYVIETCSDGDWAVIKSNYYSLSRLCSPCAPGAGYLATPGAHKTYCLDTEWFEENQCPYAIYRVDTDECVYKPPREEDE